MAGTGPAEAVAGPDRPIAVMAASIGAGSESAEALTEACLARVSARERRLHAFAWLDPEHVRRLARAVDERRRTGAAPGPLQGIPIAIKDIFDTAGVPTECGTALLRGRVPQRSAVVVEMLSDAGAVIFGKTVTAELAFAAPGPTVNPYDPERTPGGSSMGSAAAVAAGMVPAAIGTQTNSSTIMPASLCGVVGLKPTGGRISTSGVLRFSETLDQVGCFARSVADAGTVAAVIGAGDGQAEILERPLELAVARTRDWSEAAPEVRDRFDAVVALLAGSGAHLSAVDTPQSFDEARAVHRTIMAFEAERALRDFVAGRARLLSASLDRFLREGAAIARAQYESALGQREAIVDAFDAWAAEYDAVLTPAAPAEAPSRTGTGDPRFCTTWSLVGAPAVALPTGLGPAGLPVGVQLVGAREGDRRLLDVARTVELLLAQQWPRR